MATSPIIPTQNQLKLARVALWHPDGNALQTLDDLRTWLDEAGLVPYTPHAQFAAAPQPSFAEAVLGRPEKGWIVKAETDAPSEDESYAIEVEDEEPADEVEISDEDFDDDEEDDEDDAASDDEIMVSNDDEASEDEGDEIAEEDAIDAAAEDAAAEEEEVVPPTIINGFTAEERETVRVMLARLVEDGSAVPLNLLGNSLGEPDFVCSAQAFSFLYTLRGDKNFKNEPAQVGAMRVSPLAAKVYEALKTKGAMPPHELSAELGQGVVDSAVLRALSELWSILRVVPIPQADGEPATWELTTGRYLRHIKAGANAGQPTALSALLSLYLSQTLAATSDEAETFLSPVSARSRVREVVNGLSASRQLESIVLDGKTVYFLPDALDNLPEDTTVASTEPVFQQRSRYEDDDRRAMIEERNARFAAEGGTPNARPSFGERKSFGDRPRREGGFAPRREGGFAPRGDRPSYGDRKPFTPREGGERRPFTPRGDRPSFGDRKPFGDRGARPSFGDRKPFGERREGGFTPQRRSFGGDREGFTPRPDRERRPFTRNEEGGATDRPRNEFARPWDQDRKPCTPREGGDRPFTPRGDRPSFGDRKPFGDRGGRPSFGDRKPFGGDREGGERRPFTPREGGDRKPFAPRGDRPFTPRGDRPSFGDRKPFAPRGDRPSFGDRKPFGGDREGGERRPFTPRGDRPSFGGDRKPFGDRGGRPSFGGDRKPFTPREGGERRPFTPREGGDRKPFAPRGDRPFTPRGDRPSYGGDRKPFGDRGGRPSFGGDRKPFTPREAGERRPFTPREGGDRKPFAPRGDRPSFGGDRGGRPSFGDRKPFGKPGSKPSFKGPGNGPARGGAPKRRPE